LYQVPQSSLVFEAQLENLLSKLLQLEELEEELEEPEELEEEPEGFSQQYFSQYYL